MVTLVCYTRLDDQPEVTPLQRQGGGVASRAKARGWQRLPAGRQAPGGQMGAAAQVKFTSLQRKYVWSMWEACQIV